MSAFAETTAKVLVRTDSYHPSSWLALWQELARETVDGFRAYIDVLDDRTWDNVASNVLRVEVLLLNPVATFDRAFRLRPSFPRQ